VDVESNEIRRTVTLTADDVVAAHRLQSRRFGLSRPARRAAISLGLFVVIFEEFRTLTAAGVLYGAWLGLLTTLSVSVIFWLYHFLLLPSSARRHWRETPGLQRPTDLRMTPDTFSFEQVDSSARMAWSTLTRWSEDARSLLLFDTKRTFYILPRRDFGDAARARIIGWLTEAGVPRF
jgi:hypothetical protein